MRVHEIAKKLGMESRLVIPELVRLGIQVTSHSNAVEDDAARWAMDVLQGKVEAPKGVSLKEGVARNLGTKKAGGRLLKKDAAASGKAGAESTAPVLKKPEKKHILIKSRIPFSKGSKCGRFSTC
jgi:translation initiation factor IF-2